MRKPVYPSWMLEEWWCDEGWKAEWRARVKTIKMITFLPRVSYGQEAASCWLELSRQLPGATLST